jgi:TolB protein
MMYMMKKIFSIYCLVLLCCGHGLALGDIAYLSFAEGYWQIFIMDDYGKRHRQVTKSPYDKIKLSWYPSADYLLVNGSQGQVVKLDVKTATETELKLPLPGIADAVISPLGKQVAFSLSVAGSTDRNDLWLVNVDGSGLKRLTRMRGLQHEPVWASNGSQLYFLSGKVGEGKQHHDIFRYDLTTGSVTQITSASLFHFDIAVDKKNQLLYSSNQTGNYEIWYRNADNQSKQLTHHPGVDAKPSWSASSDAIVYESSQNGVSNVWWLDLTTGQQRQLTRSNVGARGPVWMPAIQRAGH